MTDDTMDHTIVTIAQQLQGRVSRMVDDELARGRSEVPEFFASDDPDYVSAYTGSIVGHLAVLLESMASGRDVPKGLPPAAVEETRTVAQWGISLDALVRTYRIAHSVIWEHAMEVADTAVTDPTLRSQALKVISRYLFAYVDSMVGLLTETYEGERMSLFHDRDRRRRQLVRDLLDGLPIDYAKLPYLVTGVHTAAVATGPGADRALTQLASNAGLSCLVVPGPSGSVWAWFGGAGLTQETTQQNLAMGIPEGVLAAFGDVAEGEEGFRVTHREARQAYRIARSGATGAVRYREVALLTLTTMDESLARQFMSRELGALAQDNQRAKELRETLRAYFDSGHNASAAAARLSLNDRTVAYRLRTIEERSARPIVSRRDELSIALRLFDYFERPSAGDAAQ